MRTVRLAEDIIPVSDFKARAADLLHRLQETGQPIVITQNGKVAGVVLSPGDYDRLTERARVVAAVEEGLADVAAGRVHAHADVASAIRSRARKRP